MGLFIDILQQIKVKFLSLISLFPVDANLKLRLDRKKNNIVTPSWNRKRR